VFQLNKEEEVIIQAHKKLWSGNGNSLSQYYSNSDSGLTSAVENGKQGFGGKLSKMFTGVKRYFATGGSDVIKNNSIKILLGKHHC